MRGKRYIEEGTVSKKEAELEGLENSQPIHIAKNEMYYGKNTQVCGRTTIAKEIRCMTCGSSQPSQ